ncbi:EF-hand domain-containing protein [uncultured Salinisphaera sp.]|uniref:EF-hand domain-containing protein n=1 Tax=uncultured Salinisphaera sp. TaxID=359372 RepID=UPI0032B3020B|tara:strand:+ start:3428 stop:4009 length:582 start_codon:yes stop_codon:yes gene_type:complete
MQTFSLSGRRLAVVTAGVVLVAGAWCTSATAQPATDANALFQALDSDGNNRLDRQELSKLPAVMARQHAKRMDTNNDGQIDEAEFEAAAKKRADHRFAAMDHDGDGRIATDAWPAPHHGPSHGHHGAEKDAPARKHKPVDADKPGHHSMFSAIDTNADGAITPDEWQTAVSRWHDRHADDHNGPNGPDRPADA